MLDADATGPGDAADFDERRGQRDVLHGVLVQDQLKPRVRRRRFFSTPELHGLIALRCAGSRGIRNRNRIIWRSSWNRLSRRLPGSLLDRGRHGCTRSFRRSLRRGTVAAGERLIDEHSRSADPEPDVVARLEHGHIDPQVVDVRPVHRVVLDHHAPLAVHGKPGVLP